MVSSKADTPLPSPLSGRSSGVLLVVSTAEETAKRIESHLRNAGHPLRAGWVTELDEVDDVLRRNPPDLLICEDTVRGAPFERVVEHSLELCPELPVLLLTAHSSLEVQISALSCGARDIVSAGDTKQLRHLELVVIREFVNHHHERQLRLTRERLEDFESRHRQLTSGTGDAIANVLEGIMTAANPAFAQLLGYDDTSLLEGQPLVDLVATDQQTRVKERLRAVLKGKHNGEPLEFSLKGRTSIVPVKAQLILGQQDGEHVIEMLIRTGDNQAAIAAANPTDAVPQLAAPRRSNMLTALHKPLPEGKVARAGLMVAIDGFEKLEGSIGYVEAEEAGSGVMAAVRTRLGAQDSLFPFSPSEFGVVVHRGNFPEIEQFGELLRREIAQLIVATQSHESHVTISIAIYPLSAQDEPQAVISQLIEEVRKLVALGGNRQTVLGETAKNAQVQRDEARRAAQVKKALDEGRLKLAYQSIASLEGEERDHFDVLLRLLDEAGKEYNAGEFLPAAQKFQLMRLVDRWVVSRALTLLGKKTPASRPTLFLKLSEDTLRDSENFFVWLRKQTEAIKLGPTDLVFQFQEQILLNHIRRARQFAETAKTLGPGMGIEHFGIGTNSAQLLNHLPADFVKFHGSFTQNFGDQKMQKRLAELLDLAKVRGAKTIVSHVEDANGLARLWQMGVNFVQGYHVQEPEVVLLSSGVQVSA